MYYQTDFPPEEFQQRRRSRSGIRWAWPYMMSASIAKIRFARVSSMANALWQIAGQRPVDPDFDKRPQKQQYELRVKRLDVEFDHQLQKCFEEAAGKGLWKGSPAARERGEYWASGVDAYFDAAGDGYAPVGAERPITTRELLGRYDPGLYALVDEAMAYQGHVDWRFKQYSAIAESTRSAVVKAASRPAETPTSAATRGRIASAPAVFKTTINPHWFHDNTRFWYRNDLADGTREFILVDAMAATRQRAFDHARLAAALLEAASAHYDADRLPFDSIDFIGNATIRFTTRGGPWECDLDTYRCARIGDKAEPGASNNGANSPQAADPQEGPGAAKSTDVERSPEDSRDGSAPLADDVAPQDVRPTPRGENRPDRRFLYWDRVVRSPTVLDPWPMSRISSMPFPVNYGVLRPPAPRDLIAVGNRPAVLRRRARLIRSSCQRIGRNPPSASLLSAE